MTEKEKAQKGYLYDANNDAALIAERTACQDLCFAYNQLRPSMLTERIGLMKQILGRIKGKFVIEQPFWCDYGYNIEIGDNFYANHNCTILDGARVSFGDQVFIAPNCGFYTAGHPLDHEQRNQGLEYAYPIRVGNHVWIGAHSIVLPGVTIADGVVIGAGSVVNKDIPAGVIAAGNPCKVIRSVTGQDRKRYWRE
ncbi:MAG: sugar O-acetyltransferase [Sporomusaceae bacterium]|nr:sugar O-acetyltransferase [Sporomusaceae bacterium]